MDCTRFGNKLSYYREKNDMTEKELARKLHITTGTLIKLEMSEKEPSMALVSRISNVFGVDFRKYLDMDEKHRGAHHFDLDDPEYSPLTKEKKEKVKLPKEKRSYSKPMDQSGLLKIISKVLAAIAGLLFVFTENIVEDVFDYSPLGFIVIPLAFFLLVISVVLNKKA